MDTPFFNISEYLIDRHVRAGHGDRVALVVEDRALTYGELLDHVETAAGGLRRLGVRLEERVLLVLLDSVEFVAGFLGAMRLGAIPLPVNPLLSGRDLGRIAADARCRVALVSAERANVIEDLLPGAPELTDVILSGGDWAELPTGARDVPPYPTWEESPGFWLCTSGTTGQPKLAMHRQLDLRLVAEGYAREVLEIAPEDRCFSVAPMFHAYGLGNSLAFPLSVGAAAILEPRRPPSPARVAEILREQAPTLFFSVPTFYASVLATDLPSDTFASVRLAVSAGEPLPADLFHRFRERFGVEILDGIGSTEMTHIFISNRPGRVVAGSSGLPISDYQVRLLDDDGNQVPPGMPGHLWVSGLTAATGYFCRTDATRRTFIGEWTRTGDVYRRTGEGFFEYQGRSDDMLKVGGEWVSPTEVEAAIVEHPAVLEVAVVGEPRPDGLQQPVAYVVAAPGHEVVAEQLIDFCRGRIAGFKRPRRVIVVEELPKTATGKISRASLREGLSKSQLATAA